MAEQVVDEKAEELTLTSDITQDKEVWMQRAREVFALAKTTGWTDLGEKKGVQVSRRSTEGSRMVMIRGKCDVPACARSIVDFVMPVESLSTLDAMYVQGSGKEVEQFDQHHMIDYARFALPWPLANRDFCWSSGADWLENGVCCVWAFSVEHEDVPRIKGVVRAEIISTGYVIEQTGDPQRCRVTYLVQSDPKSLLPTFIINAVASDQALNAMRLREYFKQNPDQDVRPPLGVGGVEKKKKARRKKNKKKNGGEPQQQGPEDEDEEQEEDEMEMAFAEAAPIVESKTNKKKKSKKPKKKRGGGGGGGGWSAVKKGGKQK